MKAIQRPRGREAIKAWHRQKIIDATVDVITTHGIAGTTLARVVELAGVSMGLVNVHFKSKDMLLLEVLRQMADEYRLHWRARLEREPAGAESRLAAMVLADFDPAVLNLKTLGVWFAFRAQVRARPEYLELVGTREAEQQRATVDLLHQLNADSGQGRDPRVQARLLSALIEGFWTEFYLYPQEFDRERSIDAVFLFLNSLYPGRFEAASTAGQKIYSE